MNRFLRAAVVLLMVGAASACSDDSKTRDPGFAGHWTSTQWGEHYIVINGSEMKVVYTHDNGRVVGTLSGDRFTGWWTESPSRQPDRDAGEVTFTLTGSGEQRKIDGIWSYGTGTKAQNWDLTWVDGTIPADVTTLLADAAQFTKHP